MLLRNVLLTLAASLATACATGNRPPAAVFGRPALAPIAGAGAAGAGVAVDANGPPVAEAAGVAVGAAGAEGSGRAPLVLPPVDLLTLDGQVTQLQAAVGGRVTVVALWATWCKTCKGELPALARLSERAAAQGAAVLGIAVGETRDTVAAFVSRRGLRYPQLVDEEFRLSALIGSDRIPTTLILDRHARITYVGGPLDESALAALRTELQRASALQ